MTRYVALAAAFAAFANAEDLATSRWGTFWASPGRVGSTDYSVIGPTYTPGSDSFDSARIARHAYYAFMDGYDTREWAATNGFPSSRAPTPSTNWAAYARHKFIAEFNDRKSNLCSLKIGKEINGNDRDGTFWGSSLLDEYLAEKTGFPQKCDFGWTRDPTYLCWNIGSSWLASFAAIDHEQFQVRRAFSPISISNKAFDGGLAVAWGWKHVRLPDDDGFAAYVEDAEEGIGTSYPSLPDVTMEKVLTNAFASASRSTNAVMAVKYGGGRLKYETIATADQTLAAFDKTYHYQMGLPAITNAVLGHGAVFYSLEGDVQYDFLVIDTSGYSIKFKHSNGLAWSPVVNWHVVSNFCTLAQTNYPYYGYSPCAGVSGISTETDGRAILKRTETEKAEWPTALGPEDVEYYFGEMAETLGITGDFYAYIKVIDAFPLLRISYVQTPQDLDEIGNYSIMYVMPPETNYSFKAHASVRFDYNFSDAADVRVRDVPSCNWMYPSNGYFLASATYPGCMGQPLEFDFFKSFVSVNEFRSTIDFDWINTVKSSPSFSVKDYGYAFKSHRYGSPAGYLTCLSAELIDNAAKCYSETRRAAKGVNPKSFVGASNEEVIATVSESVATGGHVAHSLHPGDIAGSVESEGAAYHRVHVWFDDDGDFHMYPETIVLGGTSVNLFLNVDGDDLSRPGPRSCRTFIKGLTEAHWEFPQVKRY